jgi:hypothetical protein
MKGKIMTEVIETNPVQTREAEIVAGALGWAADAGFGDSAVREALRAVGLGAYLPRETAEVSVHVTGTVTVPCGPDGTWTQDAALRALQTAVFAGRAVVEASEVPATGAPA